MKVNEIYNELDNFLNSDLSAILFDGDWGIGKTYQAKLFLNDKKIKKKHKKWKFYYISLFGKKSLDEVNTELYNLINKKKNQVLTIISCAVKLININAKINYDLKLSDNLKVSAEAKIDSNSISLNKSNNKLKKKYLVVIDDFERKSDLISNDDLLGYINNLILQGFKVVVLADLKCKYGKLKNKYNLEIDEKTYVVSKVNWGEDMLGKYKEKVFHKIYTIDETPEDIMLEILGNNKGYIEEDGLKEFNKNLRLLIKTNRLFNILKNYINNKKYKNVDLKILFRCCMYITIESFTHKYTNDLNNSIKDKANLMFFDNSVIGSITFYNKNKFGIPQNSIEPNFNRYLHCVYLVNDKNNISFIDDFFGDNKNNKVLFESCFYLSDKNKIKAAKKRFDYILGMPNKNKYSYSLINQFLNEWCSYYDYLDLSFIDEDRLFNKLKELQFKFNLIGENNNKFKLLAKKYEDYCKERENFDIVQELNQSNKKNIGSIIAKISKNFDTYNDDTKKAILKLLKSNNFYLTNITNDITEDSWQLNHLICQVVVNNIKECKDDLYNYLIKLKEENINDKSCNQRVELLVKQYFSKKE